MGRHAQSPRKHPQKDPLSPAPFPLTTTVGRHAPPARTKRRTRHAVALSAPRTAARKLPQSANLPQTSNPPQPCRLRANTRRKMCECGAASRAKAPCKHRLPGTTRTVGALKTTNPPQPCPAPAAVGVCLGRGWVGVCRVCRGCVGWVCQGSVSRVCRGCVAGVCRGCVGAGRGVSGVWRGCARLAGSSVPRGPRLPPPFPARGRFCVCPRRGLCAAASSSFPPAAVPGDFPFSASFPPSLTPREMQTHTRQTRRTSLLFAVAAPQHTQLQFSPPRKKHPPAPRGPSTRPGMDVGRPPRWVLARAAFASPVRRRLPGAFPRASRLRGAKAAPASAVHVAAYKSQMRVGRGTRATAASACVNGVVADAGLLGI